MMGSSMDDLHIAGADRKYDLTNSDGAFEGIKMGII
jgi:hypothetical protein